jgi:hypothetical protein
MNTSTCTGVQTGGGEEDGGLGGVSRAGVTGAGMGLT